MRGPTQCQRPRGWIGRYIIWRMNRRHAPLIAWGLQHTTIRARDVVLDVGCGGGATIERIAAVHPETRLIGIDYSETSVAVARRRNAPAVREGRVEIQRASVSQLPFADQAFDLVTAVETHFWWPDLPNDLREIHRVMKPGGRFAIIAEFYNGGRHARYAERLSTYTGIASLTLDEHRALLAGAGFTNVDIVEDVSRGWVCCRSETQRKRGS